MKVWAGEIQYLMLSDVHHPVLPASLSVDGDIHSIMYLKVSKDFEEKPPAIPAAGQ